MANTLTFDSLTLTDLNIYGGISYKVDLNTGEEFSIGNTASASVTFITDVQVPKYSKDQTNGVFTWTQDSVDMGKFFVTEVTRDVDRYTVTAYDAMVLLETPASDLGLTLPVTAADFVTAAAAFIGCTISGTQYNGALTISSLGDNSIRKVLGWCAEASGASMKIKGTSVLAFMYYADSGITVTASEYKTLTVADYDCDAIDNVTIMGMDGQPVAHYGTGSNTLFIQGNPFLYEATATEAENIYDRVSTFSYAPITCEMFEGNGVEVGTIVTFGSTSSLVMSMEIQTEEGVKVSSVGSDNRAELNKSIEILVDELSAQVENVSQHFWYTATGDEAGAHIAELDKQTFEQNPSGGNLLSNSSGVRVRNGLDVLAEMTSDGFAARVNGAEVFEASTSGTSEQVAITWLYFADSTPRAYELPLVDSSGSVDSIVLRSGVNTTSLTYGTASSGTLGLATYSYDGDKTVTVSASMNWSVYATVTATFTAPYFTLGTRSGDAEAYSAAIGKSVIASDNSQTAIGKYNEEDTGAFLIGNGSDDSNRSTGFKVTWDGVPIGHNRDGTEIDYEISDATIALYTALGMS